MNPAGVRIRGGYVAVEGAEALGKRFLSLVDGLHSDEVNRVFGSAAALVARTAKRLAPKSAPVTQVSFSKKRAFFSVGKTSESGRLKESIISRAFRSSAVQRYGPGAFAQVNLKVRGGNRRAPYGHIVESGRKASKAKNRFFVFLGSRGFVKTPQVAGFAGRFYFRKAVDQTSGQALDVAARAVEREIVKRYK